MLSISPLEYLLAFALTFIFGTLWALCFGCYVGKIRREAVVHA
jgi:hypothetical protein